MTTKRKRKRVSAARPAAPGHGFVVEQQPDDVTCGPACLHGVYRHYGDDVPLERIIADIHTLDQGGTLDVNGEVLACHIVNGQPAVARFSAKNYAKAKELVASQGLHLIDALSEVGYSDPAMMRGLARKELASRR